MSIHPSLSVIGRYAEGDQTLDDATLWSVESHLETCPDCRARLAGSTPADTRDLLERVAAGLDEGIKAGPRPAGARPAWTAIRRRWAVAALLPWLLMTVALLACAAVLDGLQPDLPSLVLLLAPLAPLPCVALAWSRRADPAWELIAATPGAGLALLLRRTVSVLAVVIPALAALGAATGTQMALVLLPSLACTAATIVVGGKAGLRRAALGIGVVWSLAVVLPSLATLNLSVVLGPGSLPAWALLTVALVALAATRSDDYRRLSSRA